MSLEKFREETRTWLEENCPESMRTPMPANESPGGGTKIKYRNPGTKVWMDRCAAKGFTVYKVSPVVTIPRGEYALILSNSQSSSSGFLGSSTYTAKFFDFGVD